MADSGYGPALVSMAQQFTGLPMGALIGGPLMAAAKANQQMALTQVDFLMNTCFSKSGTDDKAQYEPVMIEMVLTRGVIVPPADSKDLPTIENVNSTIKLPLLTVIPLNSLGVDNATVHFDMEVKSSYSEDHSENTSQSSHAEGSFEAKIGFALWSVDIKGSASYDSSHTTENSSHYQKSNSAKYTVDVHAGQLPLPDGVKTIIQAYANNITPIELPAPAKAS